MASPTPTARPVAPEEEPQRVCPTCATVSRTRAVRCPWCRSRFRRRTGLAIAATALLSSLATTLSVAAILTATADDIDRELRDEVTSIEDRIDREVARAQEEIEAEVRRLRDELPAAPVVSP